MHRPVMTPPSSLPNEAWKGRSTSVDNPSLTSTSLATLAFVVAPAHNGGCKRSTPGQDRIRIEDNIRQLVEFEKRQLATVDLERFVYVPPMPPGQPWEEPSPATTKSGINLTPA